MPRNSWLPKSYSTRLILMMLLLGLIPFLIFGLLLNTFDRRLLSEMDRAILQGQLEEDRRGTAVLTQMAEETIRQKALDVALQVQLYLQANPGRTMARLQKDAAFREIAIQPVLRTGYTALFDVDNAIALMHTNPAFENTDLADLAEQLPEFWSIIKNSRGGKYTRGYYEWQEADGRIQKKYMYIAPIARRSADGVRIAISTTAYVDEFTRPIKILREVSHGTSRFLALSFRRLTGAFRRKGFLFFGIGLVLSLGTAFWAGRYFSRTMVHLRRATRSVIGGQLDVRVKSTMSGDVGLLIDEFNSMVAHLEATTVQKVLLESKQAELHRANDRLQEEVDERSQAEAALRENENRLRAILETNPNPIVVYDHQGTAEFANRAFTDVFGWSPADLQEPLFPLGRHNSNLSVPGKQSPELSAEAGIEALYDTDDVIRFESQRLTGHGRTLDFLISAAPFKGPGGKTLGVIVNFTDITETKMLKAQLQVAQKMEAIGTLAGGIAHNFNNVLMGIQGLTALMLLNKEESHPDYQHLKAVSKYGDSAAELTQALLAFARGGKYEVKATDLNLLIRHEAGLFRQTKKELDLVEEYAPELWNVEVDQGQIQQVLMNLFVNAWQAMPGGGKLTVRTANVTIEKGRAAPFEVEAGRYVKFSVSDTGTGMDEDTRRKLFEPFFTTKAMGRGTGLGLATVYGIVKNHRGHIDVDSAPGQGAAFHIFLPASQKQVKPKAALQPEIVTGTGTVLLVDDEEMILDVGSELLAILGYSVLIASSGDEAVQVYTRRGDRIDLVILDMIMPGMSAAELYGQLKNRKRDIKVLLSSGYSLGNRAAEMMERGCNGFIQKPFSLESLSQKIHAILEKP